MAKEQTLEELYRLRDQIKDDIWVKQIGNDFYYSSYEYREDQIELAEVKRKIKELEAKNGKQV